MFNICNNTSNISRAEISDNISMCDIITMLNQFKTLLSKANQTREPNKQVLTDIELISLYVIKIVSPILFSIGIMGNILILLILLKKRNRVTSTAMLLTVLAISDLVIIFTSIFTQWMDVMWSWDIRAVNIVFCKLHVFLTYFSVHFSSWLLCLITFERALCVFIPHKVKIVYGKKNSLISIAVLATTVVLLNGHILVGMKLEESSGLTQCVVPLSATKYADFFGQIWPWIDFSISFAVPCTLIIVGNTAIIIQLSKARRQRKLMGAPRQKLHSLTIFMFLLSIVFVVSMAPVPLFSAVIYNIYITDMDLLSNSSHIIRILTVVMGLNPTMNFILYFLTGSKFRADVKALVCCRSPTEHVC